MPRLAATRRLQPAPGRASCPGTPLETPPQKTKTAAGASRRVEQRVLPQKSRHCRTQCQARGRAAGQSRAPVTEQLLSPCAMSQGRKQPRQPHLQHIQRPQVDLLLKSCLCALPCMCQSEIKGCSCPCLRGSAVLTKGICWLRVPSCS